MGGVVEAAPPEELVAAAQVVVGSAIGCRFAGTALATVGRAILWAAGGTVLLVGSAVLAALGGATLTGLPVMELTLAYSPGGLAEMSLIALALGLEAALVATHHIVRIFLIVVLAPVVFRIGRKTARSG
jgi:membrane AbrB-like protein